MWLPSGHRQDCQSRGRVSGYKDAAEGHGLQGSEGKHESQATATEKVPCSPEDLGLESRVVTLVHFMSSETCSRL